MSKEQKDNFGEFSSPPCYAHEIDPAYNGMIGQVELLEGERAGARVTKETLRGLKDTSDEKLLTPLGNQRQKSKGNQRGQSK